ncbi:hypothetical protein GURASL_26990 [Geotalea uraniireducens]|uniref:Uncharacterized protein n=1 Tax=Geotalea uraniireducens TaxID=351604 RepID=A0ABN6VWZ1_9BACT|nr:hypothetical protein [Geotalea uraniireducens]BDV43776.1 hypothetical protein GURASL_26990 [Geotalea uraniireducens]
MKSVLVAALLAAASLPAPFAAAEDVPSCEEMVKQQSVALEAARQENTALAEKMRTMECTPVISRDELLQRNYRQLQELAANTRVQRQSMADFENFVRWMGGSLSGYAKYIEAGSVVAGFARVLPIPYAGQASVLTKFVSQGVLALNATSVSIAKYLDTSGKFVAKVDALDPAKGLTSTQLADAARFADAELLKEMLDVQTRLKTTAEISSSSLSFLETVNQYMGSSDEYWNKTKSFIMRKDVDKHEKSFLTSSLEGLRTRTGQFNNKLRIFEDAARKDVPLIKKTVAYDDLLQELEARGARH